MSRRINIPLWVSVGAMVAACITFHYDHNYDAGLFTLGCAIYMRIIASENEIKDYMS